ncbi:erythromycin esterase family protein [Flavitalea sp.]|nr:erythromycin esterase family protein [Flavitalea sp.]
MNKSLRNPGVLTTFFICAINLAFSQSTQMDFPGNDKLYPISVADFSEAQQFQQLEPFFVNKLVVAAGEATHGTHEFFVLRSVLFSYLVKNHAFKMIAVEADFADCQLINDYIRTGFGCVDSSLKSIKGSFLHNSEFRNLIEWMRHYNASLKDSDKISLHGVDMQYIGSPVERLKLCIQQNAQALLETLNANIGKRDLSSRRLFFAPFSPARDSVIRSLLQMNSDLQKWFKDKKVLLMTTLAAENYLEVEICLTNINQSIKYYTESRTLPDQYRDSCMAENVKKLSENGRNKIFVWAHNGHVEKSANGTGRHLRLGGYLAGYYREEFYNIGFVFNQGSFIARKGANSTAHLMVRRMFKKYSRYPTRQFSLPPLGKRSFPGIMAAAKIPTFFVDLKTSTSPVFSKALPAYQLGAVYMNKNQSVFPFQARENFNAIIFVNKTTGTNPLEQL